MLAGLKHLVLVETEAPISFFGYPGRRSELAPEDCVLHVLAARRRTARRRSRLLRRSSKRARWSRAVLGPRR